VSGKVKNKTETTVRTCSVTEQENKQNKEQFGGWRGTKQKRTYSLVELVETNPNGKEKPSDSVTRMVKKTMLGSDPFGIGKNVRFGPVSEQNENETTSRTLVGDCNGKKTYDQTVR
jgi:hypothetical protein